MSQVNRWIPPVDLSNLIFNKGMRNLNKEELKKLDEKGKYKEAISIENKRAISLYVKEDLPTWSEVYYDFFKKKAFTYDPTEDTDVDLYWKLPSRKMLICKIANQFNKMLYEDDYNIKFMTFIDNNIVDNPLSAMFVAEVPGSEITSIDAYIAYMESSRSILNRYVIKEVPPIYTFPLPNGNVNPFVQHRRDVDRINIDDVPDDNGKCQLSIIILTDNKDNGIYYPIRSIIPDMTRDLDKIINWMMIPYISYFENGVGWKDDHGNLIGSDNKPTTCIGSGFDPAL